MSDKPGIYDSELFKMDLNIFSLAMKKKDFETANIISNRIMTNAWISDAQYYGIAGFFLRELSLKISLSLNVNNSNAVDSIIAQTSTFTDHVLAQVSSNKNNLKELWISFGIALEKTRKDMLTDDEKNHYDASTVFTSKTIEKVLCLLFNSTDVLTRDSNNFIKGVLGEIMRVTATYGISSNDLYIFSLFVMIERIDDYVATTAMNKKEFQIGIQNEVLPIVKKLQEICGNKIEEDQINNLLWGLIKKWRIYYVRFMEPRRPIIQNQQPIIEGKSKDELIDELAKGIEKEVINE